MTIRRLTLIALTAALVAGNACSNEPTTQEDRAAEGTAPAAAAQEAAPQPSEAGETFAGTVVETMDAGPYTYVRVEAGGREIWAATNAFQVAVGDRVVVPLDMPMEGFHSDTLDRDFTLIYFAGAIAREGETRAPVMPAGHPPVASAGAAHGAAPVAPVEAAPGGVTVAEIWAGKDRLAGTSVTVRGRIVKFNADIMGTNWMHLQDGSGSTADGNHDLTVTTASSVEVGDVVTVTATVFVDQDLGAGYRYPVLLREATVVVN
jgi:hypothetical protein